MQLASRLRDTTLGDLLAKLYRDGATGVLELIESHGRHAIHVRRGFVQAVESEGASARIGDVAVRSHVAARAAVEKASMQARVRKLRLGQAMVAQRVISPPQLDELLRRQRHERLEHLYAITDAELRFRVSRPLPPGATEQAPLLPGEVFHGRPRRNRRNATSSPPPRPASNAARVSAPSARAGHLTTLGLGVDASPGDVRSAFRRQVLLLHPDRSAATGAAPHADASRAFLAVVEAYRALTADA